MPVHACSGSPGGCSVALLMPTTSSRRRGSAGRRATAAWCAIRPRFSRRRRRGSHSTSAGPPGCAMRRASVHDSSSWSTRAPIPHAVPNSGEAIEVALTTVLERLSPTERAVYLLREGFEYPYRRIARVMGLSEPNARQLVTRARRRMAGEPRWNVDAGEHECLVDAFVAAAQTGDIVRLERLLAAAVRAEEDEHVRIAASMTSSPGSSTTSCRRREARSPRSSAAADRRCCCSTATRSRC